MLAPIVAGIVLLVMGQSFSAVLLFVTVWITIRLLMSQDYK